MELFKVQLKRDTHLSVRYEINGKSAGTGLRRQLEIYRSQSWTSSRSAAFGYYMSVHVNAEIVVTIRTNSISKPANYSVEVI